MFEFTVVLMVITFVCVLTGVGCLGCGVLLFCGVCIGCLGFDLFVFYVGLCCWCLVVGWVCLLCLFGCACCVCLGFSV